MTENKGLFLRLMFLEIKRVFKMLPKIFFGALIMAAIIFVMVFSLSNISYGIDFSSKLKLALSVPENDKKANIMMNVIKEMDTVKKTLSFIDMNEDEAIISLGNGDVYGAVIVPEGFTEGIMNGENIPAKIIFPRNSTLESTLIKLFTDSGAKSLASGQSAIYSMSDYCYENNMSAAVDKAEIELNKKIIDFTLPRSTYFKHEKLRMMGSLPIFEQYVSIGVTLFAFLGLLSCISILQEQSIALYKKLSVYGINICHNIFIKIICIFIPITSMLFVIWLFFCMVFKYNFFTLNILLIFPVISILASCFGIFIFSIFSNAITGGIGIFLISIFMLFCSGVFLPKSFLPPLINNISFIFPSTHMINLSTNLFQTDGFLENILYCFVFSLILYTASTFLIFLKRGAKK